MSTKQEDRDEFVAKWMEQTELHLSHRNDLWHARLTDANALIRLARASEHYNELVCNVEMSERESERQDRLDDARTAKAKAIVRKYGFELVESGDPRGYAMAVKFPSGASNTFGGAERGYGIPS